MPGNFSKLSFSLLGYQDVGPVIKNLVAGAPAAEIITLDLTAVKRATISIRVNGAALTGLEIWVRGDGAGGEQFQLTPDQIEAYGRNDSGSNPTTTPVNVSCFLIVSGWNEVQLRAKSAGAASLSITAGGR